MVLRSLVYGSCAINMTSDLVAPLICVLAARRKKPPQRLAFSCSLRGTPPIRDAGLRAQSVPVRLRGTRFSSTFGGRNGAGPQPRTHTVRACPPHRSTKSVGGLGPDGAGPRPGTHLQIVNIDRNSTSFPSPRSRSWPLSVWECALSQVLCATPKRTPVTS